LVKHRELRKKEVSNKAWTETICVHFSGGRRRQSVIGGNSKNQTKKHQMNRGSKTRNMFNGLSTAKKNKKKALAEYSPSWKQTQLI